MTTDHQHIDQEHPDYSSKLRMWKRYQHLYAGGEEFRQQAAEYLVRRHKEPLEIYQERLNRVFYENYLGSIIDWYTATLTRREPALEFAGTNDAAKQFYGRFVDNCDLKGTSLTQFFKQQLTQALVCGKSYVVVDFPRTAQPALTRAEEDASGRSRAYLVGYAADELINWSYDDRGELLWVVLRTSWLKQDSVKAHGWKRETRWIYYDRENFRIYENRASEQKSSIEVVDEGKHGFAGIGRVPVFEVKVSDGLWLTNKTALLQLEHFNKSNALGWALTMGLFAMPVIHSDKEWKQVAGDSYYIQLGKDDKFGWTEPEGHVYQIAADNLGRLKDEIYRVSYLMMQAGDSGAGGRVSGLSKQWDFSVTQEILRAYGGLVKNAIRNVLAAIVEARQDGLDINVSGLDEFDISDFGAEVDDATKLLGLGIQSDTLRRQVFKKVALKYLCDARQDTKTKIVEEIDTAPQI